ncbi:hypothetical protein BCR36DRAFT_413122 [Piromyces finnis]|uniref:Uncharacterized protein n=1 Tax=Piromyces finnis TaxID=1754191 RepID=A0A1Y1V7Y3_9FUNG|nr:hypothetical protein BCR36DRAFT_413122 [Piromyces finnis]|eukprot:ORX48711.1 hypothetical protein BCR36DRAFT_413122 [Piromyces finnis]
MISRFNIMIPGNCYFTSNESETIIENFTGGMINITKLAVNGWGEKLKKLDIYEQLMNDIRYLDIRALTGKYITIDFLHLNLTEKIIIHLKEEEINDNLKENKLYKAIADISVNNNSKIYIDLHFYIQTLILEDECNCIIITHEIS